MMALRLCCCTVLCLGTSIASGQEWTRFRGPNGSGVSRATTVPTQWTDADHNWRIKLPGRGHSSPVLWGKRLFIASGDEETGERIVLCVNADDGRRLWSREFPAARHGKHDLNSFASSTPAVDRDRLYVSWATPDEYAVIALDHDGQDIWRVNLGPSKVAHGFGASPIVHDDLVVVPNDQDGTSSLVALESATGEIRWSVARNGKSSYITPCVFQPDGRAAELIFTNWEHGITSIDPKTGEQNWELDIFEKSHVESAIGSPIVAGDLVLGTCGWLGVRKEVVAVRPSSIGRGKDAAEVYRIDRAAPLCTTPLVCEDLLFLWSDDGIVTCADVRTGDVHWRERVGGTYYTSPICVNDRLYGISDDGDMVVLAAAKKFERLARFPLGEGSHSTPAVAHGKLHVRTFTQLFSVGGSSQPRTRLNQE
jgi:outer membrane protein assembly factor BamB